MNGEFAAALKAGRPLVGTLLSLPSPELAEIAAGAGFDWLFLDMEHGLLGPWDVQGLVRAAAPCPCLVRIPEAAEMGIRKALDAGAAGIIVPHVEAAETAAAAVRWAKFPPEGGRSVGFSRANLYGRRLHEDLENANGTTSVVAQVEHIDGVREIERIAAVAGLAAIFIGPYDLSASLNKAGRFDDPEVREAIERVRTACHGRGLPVGIYSADAAGARRALEEDYSLVCAGMDAALYSATAAALAASVKAGLR